jgi:hypothetical protein
VEAEVTLAVSPTLVGGVDEEDGTAEQSTVMPLLIDSEDGARVISRRDGAPSPSDTAKNIVVQRYVA